MMQTILISLLLSACNQPVTSPNSDLILLKQLKATPSKAHELCEQFEDSKLKEHCKTIEKRPHLWENPKSLSTAQGQRRAGPSSKHLLPRYTPSALSFTSPLSASSCQQSQQSHLCYENLALQSQTVDKISQYCEQIDTTTWKQECYFAAAEKHLSSLGYAVSAELCFYSGSFAANCYIHLSYALAEDIPAALSDNTHDWEKFNTHGITLQQFWQQHDPQFGSAMQDLLWAKGLDISYHRAGIVAGNPIDHLPAQALYHIRAAATLHLMQMEGAQSFSLEEWALRVQRALDARLPMKAMRPPRPYQKYESNRSC